MHLRRLLLPLALLVAGPALRAADLCKQMLAYSGRGRFVVQRIDLGALVQETTQPRPACNGVIPSPSS